VSHLLFADDSLILMHADKSNGDFLREILGMYCQSLGQILNAAKSSIFFLGNIETEVKLEVCESLDIMSGSLSDKYLGLLALVGADRSDCFRHLIDRITMCINGWMEKLLCMGGKEILIKRVAQAVPTYAMMVFKILVNICKGMTDAISQYWWGDDDDKKRIYWQAWWKLCFRYIKNQSCSSGSNPTDR
jgi:hypothetical protein